MENRTNIILEEYIPLKIIINKDDEAVDYLTFSKNNMSYIELTFGINSHFLKRVTLLSSHDFEYSDERLLIDKYIETNLCILKNKIKCDIFKTIIYQNGAKIILSSEKASRYVKVGNVFLGLSNNKAIVNICVCEMSLMELNHLKNELELQ